jgi:hypothetical protein
MKKFIIPAVLACITGLFACTKEGTTTTVTNIIRDTTIINKIIPGVVNADTLSAGIKVGYGSRITGEFPTASPDAAAPALDTFYNKVYKVIKSRYLVIYPPVTSGHIAGYYVQIAGAKSYFKVDYTQAYNLRKAQHANARGEVSGYYDSAIVFKLPAVIIGDTFYVKYAAYDSLNRLSQPVTAQALILPEGNDQFTDSLVGNWRYAGNFNLYSNGTTSHDGFNLDTATATKNGYYTCTNNKLKAMDGGAYYLPATYYVYREIYKIEKYGWSNNYQNIYKDLNLDSSSCSNYVYSLTSVAESGLRGMGGYSYDQVSKRLTMVYEESNKSNTSLAYETFYLNELTDTRMVIAGMVSDGDTDDGTYYKLYIKQ